MAGDEVIILAGGFGTRLRAVISDVPKPLAPVAGQPFLHWVLEHLAVQGMRRVILATGYLAETVEQAFGSYYAGLSVDYSVEAEPLGTGGAIALATQRLQGGSAHVVNGDTFLHYSPQALEASVTGESDIGVALAHVPDVTRYGSVSIEASRVRAFSEKGHHGAGWINAGCYFLTARAIAALPTGKFSFETDVLHSGVQRSSIAAFTETTGFIDIGIPEDYLRAQQLFGAQR